MTENQLKSKKLTKKYKFINDNIADLQQQHLKDKADFLNRIHTMDADQIIMENLLLTMEEQVYFKSKKNFPDEDPEEKRLEMEFIKNQTCCDLAFKNYNEWAIHMDNHSEIKNEEEEVSSGNSKGRNYKCDIVNCNKSYTSAYGLRYHLDKGHKGEEDTSKPYVCNIDGCKKRYKNANGLKYHVQHGHEE